MKKIFYLLSLFILFFTISVSAAGDIYSINMDIYLNEQGDANITEIWDVKAFDGSEWFKQIKNLNGIEITNYTVSMDNIPLTRKDWNINESLNEKKGFYGINNTDDGIELCFGKYDYERHTFTIKYTMTNVIFNTSDAQVFIGKIANEMPGHNFYKFKATISSFYEFPDTLPVWGTGYDGLAYVSNGKAYFSNDEKPDMGEKSYVSALMKFPLNTFNTTKIDERYETFENVESAYKEGTSDNNPTSIWSVIIPILGFGAVTGGIIYFANKNGYGYINNKKIKEKETPAFRDIPCDKDLFYANSLMKLNGFGYNATNILGAVILKWVKEEKIKFIKTTKQGLFKEKEEYSIVLNNNPKFENNFEERIFNIMYEASADGILEPNEFKNWTRLNITRFQDLFKNIEDDEETKLKKDGHIYKRKSKEECSRINVMDDKMYEDAKRLLGLKIFLKEFSEIDKRETIEVKIWDEYLMFAYIFGIADKVFNQLKKLYPEIIEQNMDNYNAMYMANTFASDAIRAANSYSAGGGGYSTGGGGGGGFGGGVSGGR